MKGWNIIEIGLVAAGGWAAFFFGDLNGLFWALVAFVAIDYISGVIKAIMQKNLSSAVGYKGILKKLLIFAVVGLGHMLDRYVLAGSDYNVIRTMIIMFYLSNEGISVVENLAEVGVPVPEKLINILRQLKNNDKNDKSEKTEEGEK